MLSALAHFDPDHDSDFFAALPAAAAVFLLRGEPASEPYVSKTANLRRRLLRLLGPAEAGSRRLNLRDRVRTVEYTLSGSDFESGFLLYKTLRSVFPANYRDRLRLRFAPLIKLVLDNQYPRATITTRIGKRGGKSLYYGPFFSRASAEKFANDSLDFFKMRRCVDDLHPDPAFPGCIYSEMKMCLAPCFQGCTDDEYGAEVARVQAFFDNRGGSFLRQLAADRERASGELEFETAAAIHARMEKVKAVAHLPEVVGRIDRMAAIMVQPSAIPDSVALFHIHAGCIADPLNFPLNQQPGQPHSMEARVEQALKVKEAAKPQCGSALELMEHLALLRRWYYRSSKSGEIFFADEKDVLPLRRIVRGIARVFRGEKPQHEQSTPGAALSATPLTQIH